MPAFVGDAGRTGYAGRSLGAEPASPRPKPPHRYVCVIGPAAGLQKVGLATDPRSRLAALQTACPFDLLLHVAVAVPFGEAHAIERRTHRALARACVRNEWFSVTPAEAVTAVRAAADPPEKAAPVLPVEWLPREVPSMTSVGVSPKRSTRSRTKSTRSARHPLQDAISCQVTSSPIGNRSSVSRRLDVCTPSGMARAL